MKKKIFIFDLDDTVIDSSHRATFRFGEGNNIILDLDAWKKDSTRENIFKDELLPLADFMKFVKDEGHFVWVCTARNMQQADHDFLAHHGLTPNVMLSRQLDDNREDHILKRKMVSKLLNLKPFKNCEVFFFDDKEKNRDSLEDLCTEVFNAQECNELKMIGSSRGAII